MNKLAIIVIAIVVVIILVLVALQLSQAHNMENNNAQKEKHSVRSENVSEEKTVDIEDTLRVAFYDGVFYINEKKQPKLKLQRGRYYEFANSSNEPIYFTTDPVGGIGQPGCLSKNRTTKFRGLSLGVLFFRITDDLPDTFYYQSTHTPDTGGVVNLIDPLPEYNY